jgi:hypothetical protein
MPKMETISFKMPLEMVQALNILARENNERSHNTFARSIVMEFLAGTLTSPASPVPDSAGSLSDTPDDRHLMEDAVTEVFQQVIGLREDLANSMVVLLQHAGQVKDRKKAKRWVSRTLMARFKGKYNVSDG